ncbi:unnamed protein product [Orchesella dallaii]|uniref:Uncharacterized protein n=1 Tax=Orchesella dallaii TaxID=48710 RepID=A0ABP1RCL5_9HEXA
MDAEKQVSQDAGTKPEPKETGTGQPAGPDSEAKKDDNQSNPTCSPIGIPTNGPRTNVTNVINANITVEPVKLTPIAIPQIEKENSSSIWFDSINDFANGHTGLLMAICICQILILIMQCRNQKRKLNERNEGQLANKFAEKPGGVITPISPEELQLI